MANYKLLNTERERAKQIKKRKAIVSLAPSTTVGYNLFARNLFIVSNYKNVGSRMGGKIVSSHGSTHSSGVMILFKPRRRIGRIGDFNRKIGKNLSGKS